VTWKYGSALLLGNCWCKENVCYLHLRNPHSCFLRESSGRDGGGASRWRVVRLAVFANKGASEWTIDQASRETRCYVDVWAGEETRKVVRERVGST
jgi:hypothetical protein